MNQGDKQQRIKSLREVKEFLSKYRNLDYAVDLLDKDNIISWFTNQINKYRVMRECPTPINVIKEEFEAEFTCLENHLFWELLDKKVFGDEIL
ncbi:hypothetical protein [Priestia megaterium]|uniref:hypothetical protein n=1 Tax=Priestia megaterium TaxID=1404 RepID=UPI002FFEBE9E